MSYKGIFFALLAGFFFGLSPTFAKLSYDFGANPAFAIFVRFFIASIVIVLPFFIIRKNFDLILEHIFPLLLISFGFISLTTGLLVSVNYIPVSLVAIIFYTYPLFVVIFAFFKGKKISIFQIIGFFVTFVGLIFALGPSFINMNLIGFFLALLASFGASIILITNDYLSKHFHAIIINTFINFTCCLIFSIIIFSSLEVNLPQSSVGWICIIFSAVFYSIALFFQLGAVEKIGSAPTSLLLYIEPIVAIISAIILLGESLTYVQIIGTSVVLLSLIVITRDLKKN